MSNSIEATHLRLTTQLVGDTAVLRLRGEVDLAGGEQLRAVGTSMLADGARNLVVDCAGVTFMDSAGALALADLRQAAHERCGAATVRHPGAAVRRLLDLASLGAMLGDDPPD